MSQVLGFGFPSGERLLCENPACTELATFQAKIGDGKTDLFGCGEHINQLTLSHRLLRLVKLEKPGERNPEPKKNEESSSV